MKRWVNGFRLRAAWTRAGVDAAKSKKHPTSPIYVLEEDDLERADPPESDQEAFERNERIAMAAWAEVERLRPIVGRPPGEPVPVDDRRVAGPAIANVKWQLRANKIYEGLPTAARGVLVAASSAIKPMLADDWDALAKFCSAMVDVHQSMLGAPMPRRRTSRTESTCNCECGGNYCGCPCHDFAANAGRGTR